MTAASRSLKTIAQPVANKEAICLGCSCISRSEKVGEPISEAMGNVGNDNVSLLEESRGMETELVVVEGMQFDPWLSFFQYMVTDNEKMVFDLEIHLSPDYSQEDFKYSRYPATLRRSILKTNRPL